MKRMIALCLMCILHLFGVGQITVTNTMSPQELVQNVLVGSGVVASNITYNGSSINAANVQTNVGFFDAASTLFPISSGLVISSGTVSTISGAASGISNTVLGSGGDPDLFMFSDPYPIQDACVIEFDFMPSGNTISLQFIFASEEYPEYVNSTYNDQLGLFISGPGFSGPFSLGAENIALLPDGITPISINNVNHLTNSQYYIDNSADFYGVTSQFDGYTVVLTATAEVQCGEVYHIKLAVGDTDDSNLDSAMFFAAESFNATSELVVSFESSSGDTVIVEDCYNALLNFSRTNSDLTQEQTVHYSISGSAINGVDYTTLPDSVVFQQGEEFISLPISAFNDGLIEGTEELIIEAYTVSSCADTSFVADTLRIIDGPEAVFMPSILEGCGPLEVVCANSSINGVTFEWNFGNGQVYQVGTVDNQTVTLESSSTVRLIAFDQYNCSDTAYHDIEVYLCGCTDPISENYNPMATKDDGSCIFPGPEVILPNVFTPNDDGFNDTFFAKSSNIQEMDISIHNRWGNVLWSKTYDPAVEIELGWDGTNEQGLPASEGTYFYSYRAISDLNEPIFGNGFFQLVRD